MVDVDLPGRFAVPVPTGVRLIASDLDGTLLLPDGSVGERTRQSLDALRDSDIDLVIATGRPPRWISPIVDMTGHRGVGIAANGGVVLDLADGHVTEIFPLSEDQALAAIERARSALPGVVFAVERARPGGRLAPTGGSSYDALDATLADATEFALGDGYTPRWPVPRETHVAPIEELIATGDVVKILVRPGGDFTVNPLDFLTVGLAALDGLVEVTHAGIDDVLLEISAPGVTKATTLARVAAAEGHGALHVVAAGDGPNDLPMLAWAGTSYAMANGHPQVLDLATHVLPSNADEGVADLIDAVLAESVREFGDL
jgi:hydroxymethylpyrimidine pyrophosphatase-like HAD family hydrolase